MFKEEQVLFPAIRRLEQSETQPTFPFGTVANPIRMMEHEHDTAGNALDRIRELTCDYAGPRGRLQYLSGSLDGLRVLEGDMHLHVHKENSILFPKAVEREGALTDTARLAINRADGARQLAVSVTIVKLRCGLVESHSFNAVNHQKAGAHG